MKFGFTDLHQDEEAWEFGWKHMIQVLWRELFTLIKANLCFFLFCIPVVTIPAAVTAIHNICVDAVRGKPVKVMRAYGNALKTRYLASFGALAILAGLIVLGCYGTTFYWEWPFPVPMMRMIILLPAAFAVVGILMIPYCFCMLACMDLPLGKVIKNSFLLVFLNLRFNICGGVIGTAMILLQIQFWLPLLPVILSCGIAIAVYVSSYFAFYGIEKFVVIKNDDKVKENMV